MDVQEQIVHVDFGKLHPPRVNMILNIQRHIGNKISINYMLMSEHYNELLIDSLLSPTGRHIFNLINSQLK